MRHLQPISYRANLLEHYLSAEPVKQEIQLVNPINGMLTSDQKVCDLNRLLDSRPRSGSHLTSQSAVNGRHSPSSATQADVPQSVESETDNEIETSTNSLMNEVQLQAPPPPPKDEKIYELLNTEAGDFEPDASTTSYDSANNEMELFPVARAPHTVYVAPALPPIRFSMNSVDFTDLLNTVSGLRSRDALVQSEPNGDDVVSSLDTIATEQNIAIQSSQQVIGAIIPGSKGDDSTSKLDLTGDVKCVQLITLPKRS